MLVKPQEAWNNAPPDQIVVSIRPEKIQVGTPSVAAVNCYEGTLKHVMYLGTHVHYVIELLTGDQITVLQPNRTTPLPLQAAVQVYWDASDCLALTP